MSFELEQRMYDELRAMCMETYKNMTSLPVNKMFERLMKKEDLPIHCPYHHYLLPAAILTQIAISERRKKDELETWLDIAEERGKTVPGGFCGNCGSCGAGIGMGIAAAVYTGSSPLATEVWQIANEVTGRSLVAISKYPGPRCCKRTAYLAASEAIPYLNEKLGLKLEIDEDIKCRFSHMNAECLTSDCPFFDGDHSKKAEDIPIVVGEGQLPKPEPGNDCKCMHEIIDFTKKRGLVKWLVEEGAEVTEGQVICEGEINKKVVEFTAPASGILALRNVDDKEVFTAGTILGYIRPE